jgi:hypothetical protein
MSNFSGLLVPDEALLRDVDESSVVSSGLTLDDFPDWRRFLVPENDPENWGLRNEYQRRNDCQANAATSGAEVIEYRTKGKRSELSRMFVYQWSEYFDGGIGRDRGSTIPAGVKVLKELGAPTEEEYPYSRYTRDTNQLRRWSDPVQSSARQRVIVNSVPAPPWEQLLPYIVSGNPLHWGTWWPIQWDSKRVVRRYRGRHGSGGHATAGVWVTEVRGEVLLKVANSHNDGYFYVSEDAYEEMRDRRLSPFGAYVLQGESAPFKKFVFI